MWFAREEMLKSFVPGIFFLLIPMAVSVATAFCTGVISCKYLVSCVMIFHVSCRVSVKAGPDSPARPKAVKKPNAILVTVTVTVFTL